MPPTWARIAAVALSVYCASASPQPTAPPGGQPGQVTTDETLTKAVYSTLNADPNYYFRHVHVSVDKGVATLSGHVDSGAAITRARKTASKVPGVTRVLTHQLQIDTQLRR
jgi:osmotically-inducible protein OsmY